MPSDLAWAIAQAEGFGVKDAIPTKAHNPGDLVMDWLPGEKMGTEGIHVFQDDATGWAALEHQLDLIRDGKSQVYQASMTLGQMAMRWTRTQPEDWGENVAAWFNHRDRSVDLLTPLKELL